VKTNLFNFSNNPQKLEVPYLLFPKEVEVDGKWIVRFILFQS